MKVIYVCIHANICTIVISVCFDQSAYIIPEQGGPLTITMMLNNPSSSEIIVQAAANSGSALGMFLMYVYMLQLQTYV